MVKRVHEVWAGKGGAAMFTRGAKNARETLPVGYQLVRTFEAESRFEAFRTHYRLMGYGEWREPEGVADLFYTGDDEHDFS
jgi:hypothetical protein